MWQQEKERKPESHTPETSLHLLYLYITGRRQEKWNKHKITSSYINNLSEANLQWNDKKKKSVRHGQPRLCCSWYGRLHRHKGAQQKSTVNWVHVVKRGVKDEREAERAAKRRGGGRRAGGGETGKEQSGLDISLQHTPVRLCQLITQRICLHPWVGTKWGVW